MADEGISYEMLQDLLRAERRSNKLSVVEPRFWSKVRDFLADAMARFRAEQEKDPFGRKAMMLRDEAQHAKQAAEGVWALRERKMALFALAQAKEGGSKRPEGITRVEEEIYDGLMATLRDARQRVLHGGDAVPAAAQPPTPAPIDVGATTQGAAKPKPTPVAPSKPAAAPAEAPPEPPKVVPSDTPAEDAVMIRALADIPPFVGPDMQTYLLKSGDVATVPVAIAKLLQRRQKAELMQA